MDLFHVIKNKNKYWLVDQIDVENVDALEYEEQAKSLFEHWHSNERGYLSLIIDEFFEEWLLNFGFKKVSSIVNYSKELMLSNINSEVEVNSLAEGLISEDEFASLYDLCREGTANKNKKQAMKDVMAAIKSELGPNWKNNCYYFKVKGDYVGISIPHIEIGKTNEGRLFYFGVVPVMRNQGLGKELHKVSLSLLKNEFDATYYIGSTDVHNEPMINIFVKNGCSLKSKKGIYRIEKE